MGFRDSAIEALDAASSSNHDDADYHAFRGSVYALLDIADAIRETSQVEHLKQMLEAKPDVEIITARSGNKYVTLKFSDGTIHEFSVTNHKMHKT